MRQLSTWVSAAVAMVCGGLLGAFLTITHRAAVPLGGWSAPIGLALGLLAVLAFVLGCRLLWEPRLPAIGAALGLVVAEAVTADAAAGLFLADDPVTMVWLLAAPLLAAIVVAWPRRSAPRGDAAISRAD